VTHLKPLVLATLLLPPFSAAAQTSGPAEPVPVVVTAGEGIVKAVPDRAFVTITAESRAANPRDAQKKNAEQMKPVLDKLRSAGIPQEAIRTTSYELHMEYDWVRERRVAKGYVARNSVEVRVDDIDRLGELLDIAVTAGATDVGGIRFDLKERARLERDALRLAVQDARARGEAIASASGQTIEGVLRVEEQGVSSPPPMPMMRQAMGQEDAAASVPIAAGEMELRGRVTLTLRVK
jgi:uncharacterized protein YggE